MPSKPMSLELEVLLRLVAKIDKLSTLIEEMTPVVKSIVKPDTPWIDNKGYILKGEHAGEYLLVLAKQSPGYINWLLENVEGMKSEDRGKFSKALDDTTCF